MIRVANSGERIIGYIEANYAELISLPERCEEGLQRTPWLDKIRSVISTSELETKKTHSDGTIQEATVVYGDYFSLVAS